MCRNDKSPILRDTNRHEVNHLYWKILFLLFGCSHAMSNLYWSFFFFVCIWICFFLLLSIFFWSALYQWRKMPENESMTDRLNPCYINTRENQEITQQTTNHKQTQTKSSKQNDEKHTHTQVRSNLMHTNLCENFSKSTEKKIDRVCLFSHLLIRHNEDDIFSLAVASLSSCLVRSSKQQWIARHN
jgi:hypothetical protein